MSKDKFKIQWLVTDTKQLKKLKDEIRRIKTPLCKCRKYTPTEIYMCRGVCVMCGKELEFQKKNKNVR